MGDFHHSAIDGIDCYIPGQKTRDANRSFVLLDGFPGTHDECEIPSVRRGWGWSCEQHRRVRRSQLRHRALDIGMGAISSQRWSLQSRTHARPCARRSPAANAWSDFVSGASPRCDLRCCSRQLHRSDRDLGGPKHPGTGHIAGAGLVLGNGESPAFDRLTIQPLAEPRTITDDPNH
jgi:hypothetical protein